MGRSRFWIDEVVWQKAADGLAWLREGVRGVFAMCLVHNVNMIMKREWSIARAVCPGRVTKVMEEAMPGYDEQLLILAKARV